MGAVERRSRDRRKRSRLGLIRFGHGRVAIPEWLNHSKSGNGAAIGESTMTRLDIESEYDVENGQITSPGKFEGEPVYTPYFWESYLNGFFDDDDDGVLSFN